MFSKKERKHAHFQFHSFLKIFYLRKLYDRTEILKEGYILKKLTFSHEVCWSIKLKKTFFFHLCHSTIVLKSCVKTVSDVLKQHSELLDVTYLY